jgi:Putative bacterial sensory transduction regulator
MIGEEVMKAGLLSIFLTLAAGSPALAQNVTADDPDAIVKLLQEWGYRATLVKDSQGDPKIDSATAGVNFSVYFYGCTAGADCSSIQLSSGFDMESGTTPEVVNAWNSTKRFGKVYLDDEQDPFIEMDITLAAGGVSRDNFRDDMDKWEQLLSDFQTHIDW